MDLLEVPDAVVGQVQVRQCCERVQSRAHTFHVVTRHEQRGEVRQVGQPAQRREAVVVQEQRLQLLQCVQALHDTDLVGVQVQVPQLRAMLQVLDTLHLTLAHPQLLEVRAVLEAGQLRDHGHLDKADLGEVGEVAHHIATHAEGLECVQACHRVWLVVDLVLRQALRQALHDSATGVSQHSPAHVDAHVDAPARATIRPDHPGRASRGFHRLPHVSTWRRLRCVLRHTTRTKILRGTPATPPSHFVGVLRELAENSRSHQPACIIVQAGIPHAISPMQRYQHRRAIPHTRTNPTGNIVATPYTHTHRVARLDTSVLCGSSTLNPTQSRRH